MGRRSVFWPNASVHRQRVLKEVNVKGHIVLNLAAALFFAVMPVAAQQPAGDLAAKIKEEAAKPTPRLSDGHPDLTGFWAADRTQLTFFAVPIVKSSDGKTVIYAERDAPELDARAQPNFKARAADK